MNNKFKPEEVPDWVNWIAQDAGGEWWYYEDRPFTATSIWFTSLKGMGFLYKSKPPQDFTQELYKWE